MLSTRSHAGFTLLELLVTMSIFAILLALAVPSFTGFVVNSQLRSTVSTLQTDVMNARAEAIKLAKPVVVRPLDASLGWQSGWTTVVLDTAGSSDVLTLITRDTVSDYLAVGKKTISGTILYDSAGFSRDSSGSFIAGCIRFDAAVTSRVSALYIDAAGRPRTCSVPTAGNTKCCA